MKSTLIYLSLMLAAVMGAAHGLQSAVASTKAHQQSIELRIGGQS